MHLTFLVVAFGVSSPNIQRSFANESPELGVFCGSTPCDAPIRQVLGIATDAAGELIEWKLTLYHAPSRYELRCDYGLTTPGKPGLASGAKTLERKGTWTRRKGANPATVYELNGAVSLLQVDTNILQVLNQDGTLMVGNGGWSYTLNRVGHSEETPQPAATVSEPVSYRISELATGPAVFGVFEGRSPCQGIARELKIPTDATCRKAKWRVTLYQNPQTQGPTTYKVEGTLYRASPREGNWSISRGSQKDPNAIVYQLAGTKSEPALFLLRGDDNVLFFLDQKRNPLVGNCEFSYTLNRRTQELPTAPKSNP